MTTNQTVEYELCSIDDIPAGTMRAFDADGRRVLVCNVDGALHVVDELCPHLAVPLGHGTLDGAEVTCPGHGSVFNVSDGTCSRWIGRKPGVLAKLLSSTPTSPEKHPVAVIDGLVVVTLPLR